MLTEKDLLPFVSHEEYRKTLQNIIHTGAEAIATDGAILIAIPSDEPCETETKALEIAASCESIIQSALMDVECYGRKWAKIPDFPHSSQKDCPECDGTGKAVDCDCCDGKGELELDHDWQDRNLEWHYDHYTVECSVCDGTGTRNELKKSKCTECNGTGKVDDDIGIDFGFAVFSNRLLEKIIKLPGCEMRPAGRLSCTPIRGDGWRGVIMPRREQETDIKIAWPE